jgi:hypothetical protein
MTREAFDFAEWGFRPRLRYQSENISEPDWCPACSAGFVVDEEGFPMLDEAGRPVMCSLCKGRGMIFEPCCPDADEPEHEGAVIDLGEHPGFRPPST